MRYTSERDKLNDTSGDTYIPRRDRIRDEQDGATAAAWGLCGIFVLFLGFVLAVIYWSPK